MHAPVQGARLRGRRDRMLGIARRRRLHRRCNRSTRCARCRSGTRLHTGSPTFRSRRKCSRAVKPRSLSFADGDVDPAEAFILRDLGMNALLMLPIRVVGTLMGPRRALRDAAPSLRGGRHRGRAVPRCLRPSAGSRRWQPPTRGSSDRRSTSCRRIRKGGPDRVRGRRSSARHQAAGISRSARRRTPTPRRRRRIRA